MGESSSGVSSHDTSVIRAIPYNHSDPAPADHGRRSGGFRRTGRGFVQAARLADLSADRVQAALATLRRLRAFASERQPSPGRHPGVLAVGLAGRPDGRRRAGRGGWVQRQGRPPARPPDPGRSTNSAA